MGPYSWSLCGSSKTAVVLDQTATPVAMMVPANQILFFLPMSIFEMKYND